MGCAAAQVLCLCSLAGWTKLQINFLVRQSGRIRSKVGKDLHGLDSGQSLPQVPWPYEVTGFADDQLCLPESVGLLLGQFSSCFSQDFWLGGTRSYTQQRAKL